MKLDRYGWKLSSNETNQLYLDDPLEEQRLLNEWMPYLKSFTEKYDKNRDAIAKLVKKGIPDAIRGQIWPLILNYEKFKQELPQTYGSLVDSEPVDSYYTIHKDIPRSFPQVGLFTPKLGLSLEHLLQAYSQVDRELGYTQGMNFIAGLLIMYCEEEIAFYTFYSLLKGNRVNHRNYFIPPFTKLSFSTKMFEILLNKKYKKIYQNLINNGVALEMFTSSWFITGFQHLSFSPVLQLKIFDRFLFYGTRCLLSFGLVIFSRHKIELLKGSIETLLMILQKPDESEKMKDWKYILKKWDEHWISKSDYIKLLKQVNAPKEEIL